MAGAEAAVQEASLRENRVRVALPAGEHAGEVWSLTSGKAAAGVLEDSGVGLGADLPRVLSFFPDEVFEIDVKRLK